MENGFTLRLAYGDLDAVRTLFREYAESLHVDLSFQDYAGELEHLPGKYALPEGRLYLAWQGETPAACGALRPLGDGLWELKRLYVRPACRGSGLGMRLAEQLLSDARALGARAVRLDTLASMHAAQSLYARLGFREIPAYYANPLPGTIYLERPL